jgi:hypothetical protein
MRIRSYPLAERRALARAMGEELDEHRRGCARCMIDRSCSEARDLAAELAEVRREIRHWFDPGPDQVPLFGAGSRDD